MAKNPWQLPRGYDAATRKALSQMFAALKNARTHISPAAYEALRLGNVQAFVNLVDWESIGSDLGEIEPILQDFAAKTGVQLYKDGDIVADLLFDIVDARAVIWAQNHTADLVVEIAEEMRQQIRNVMAESTQGLLTYEQAARKIRTNLSLTSRDSAAVDSYYSRQINKLVQSGMTIDKATEKASARADRYGAKLLRKRSQTIARTELANAASNGRRLGWETGVSEGYIDPASTKEWVAEPDACDICGPMDGVSVPMNDEFPSGVMMPPQHPNCRCAAVLLPPDYSDEYWTAYAKDDRVDTTVTIVKHMAGKHDQSSHGRGSVATLEPSTRTSALYPIPKDKEVYSGTEIAASFPYVGQSEKALGVASAIGPTQIGETSTYTNFSGKVMTDTNSRALYNASNGKIYALELTSTTNWGSANRTRTVVSVANQPEAKTPRLTIYSSGKGYSVIELIGNAGLSGINIGTAMLEFARRELPEPIFHSNDLSAEGKRFAETTKSLYKAESYKPTEGMKIAANRALRWKDEGKAKGAGTPVGWGRATDIAAGRSMSLDIVKRMFSFFSRHEVDKQGKDFKNISEPSNGRIMWDAWGGDAGFTWSRAIVEGEKRKVEKHLSGKHDQSTHGRGAGTMVGVPATDKKSVTPEQLSAIKFYTGTGFRTMNDSLRGKSTPSADPEKLKTRIKDLDGAIANSEIKESMIVSRVVGATALVWYSRESRIETLKKLVGKTITEKGFLSTTKKATIGSSLGQLDKEEDVFLKIHAPKGTKALDISTVSYYSKEQEVIFPRDSKLTILSVKPSTKYAAIVEAEISN